MAIDGPRPKQQPPPELLSFRPVMSRPRRFHPLKTGKTQEIIKGLTQHDNLEKPVLPSIIYGHWYALGQALHVDDEILDEIADHSSQKPAYARMLSAWLKRSQEKKLVDEPTWEALVDALRDPTLALIQGIKGLANKIDGHFCSARVSVDCSNQNVDVKEIKASQSRSYHMKETLKRFLVNDVTETNVTLAKGEFAKIIEYRCKGVIIAGKLPPQLVMRLFDADVPQKYLKECVLMSNLKHPNIAQFRGVHFLEGSSIPVMLMERLEIDFGTLLEKVPDTSLGVKISIFADIARGLSYLHCKSIIHRAIVPSHILLDGAFVAKISGMRWGRMIQEIHLRQLEAYTKKPGPDKDYSPPEYKSEDYGTPLDIFSLGHLMLKTSIQCEETKSFKIAGERKFDAKGDIAFRSEVDRREQFFTRFREQFGDRLILTTLITQCLNGWKPDQRPTADKVVKKLEDELEIIWDPSEQLVALIKLKMWPLEDKTSDKDCDTVSHQSPLPDIDTTLDDEPDTRLAGPESDTKEASQPNARKSVDVLADIINGHPSAKAFKIYPDCITKYTELGAHDLQYVVRLLSSLPGKWETIGQVLTVTNLTTIKTNYNNDPQRCLLEMLHSWLNGVYDRHQCPESPCGWRLVWAVADIAGGQSRRMAEAYAKSLSEPTFKTVCYEVENVGNIDIPLFPSGVDVVKRIQKLKGDLQRQLSEVGMHWFQIGVLMGITVSNLNACKQSSDDDSLRYMLDQWLNNSDEASVQHIVEAVAHPAGGNNPVLAKDIATHYQK